MVDDVVVDDVVMVDMVVIGVAEFVMVEADLIGDHVRFGTYYPIDFIH